MQKILIVLFLALVITISQGFPQETKRVKDNEEQSSTPLSRTTPTPGSTAALYNVDAPAVPPSQVQTRRYRDTEKQTKPLDRSQISTLPATVNIQKQDTIPKTEDHNRKTRDTYHPQPLDRSQISTLPATVNITKEDNVPFKASEGNNSRVTRGVESSKHRTNPSDIEASPHRQNPQTQTYQSRDHKPSHLTKDIPASPNQRSHHPGLDTHNTKQH